MFHVTPQRSSILVSDWFEGIDSISMTFSVFFVSYRSVIDSFTLTACSHYKMSTAGWNTSPFGDDPTGLYTRCY